MLLIQHTHPNMDIFRQDREHKITRKRFTKVIYKNQKNNPRQQIQNISRHESHILNPPAKT